MYEDHRICSIYKAIFVCLSLDLDRIFHMAGRKKFSRSCTLRSDKFQCYLCRCSRHTVNRKITFCHSASVLYRNLLDDLLLCVGIENMNLRHRLYSFNKSLVDRIRTDGRRDISAVHRLSDDRCIDIHLAEIIVDINSRAITLFDHRNLARRCVCTTHTVDLTPVRTSERAQDHFVALRNVFWEILIAEEYGFAGAAAHVDTWDFFVWFVHKNYLLGLPAGSFPIHRIVIFIES